MSQLNWQLFAPPDIARCWRMSSSAVARVVGKSEVKSFAQSAWSSGEQSASSRSQVATARSSTHEAATASRTHASAGFAHLVTSLPSKPGRARQAPMAAAIFGRKPTPIGSFESVGQA